jgi:NADPH:quinone reductase
MTAVGGADVLQLAELPEPEVATEHDVRVRLRAAGVNPADDKMRSSGTIDGSLPAVLGSDGAGVVESVGPAVTRVRPGDEVYFCDGGFVAPGTYQEDRIVDERYLAHKPKSLSFVEAAAAPLVTITAWEALGEKLRDWTAIDGADIVHDTVGGKAFTACFSLVRPYGLVGAPRAPADDSRAGRRALRSRRLARGGRRDLSS